MSEFRAVSYCILRRTWVCVSCGSTTPVHAFLLPAGHAMLQFDDDSDAIETSGRWETVPVAALLFHVETLSDLVQQRLRRETKHFSRVRRAEQDEAHFANHCEHCGVEINDRALFEEYPPAFAEPVAGSRETIETVDVAEPFEAFATGCVLRLQSD